MEETVFAPLDSERVYYSNDELTLDGTNGSETLKMGVWICQDPVRIHKMIVKDKILQVDEIEVLNPLESKLRRADPDYWRRWMGLKITVDYPGFGTGVMASIPYETDPVGFYKWWRKGKHEDKVFLSVANRIRLFQKIYLMDPKVLLKKDIEIVK